jgi:hypothetical protein
MGHDAAARHYADAENTAIEHRHHHDHPEVGHPKGALHHELHGSDHPHEHRFQPSRIDHHPVEPHPVEFPDDDPPEDPDHDPTDVGYWIDGRRP